MGEGEARLSVKLNRYSFGSTSAIVTSVGLIVGFGAATTSRSVTVGSLLIIAVADNITDSLSIHIYQESEQLEGKVSFRATLTNFVTRLLVAATFIVLVLLIPPPMLGAAAITWGMLLLAALTYALARTRGVPPGSEIAKHLVVAVVVVAVSRALGALVLAYVH